MTQLPHDDDQPLIHFLKQYRPIPPKTATSVERQLMELVAKESRSSTQKLSAFKWMLPTALAAAGLVSWMGWKNTQYTPQLATQPGDLEAFVIDSWNGANEQLSNASRDADLDNAWFIPDTPDTHSKQTQQK